MKIPKKLIVGAAGLTSSALPVVGDEINARLKEKAEKSEQERRYINQRRNGMVKYASILFSLVSLFLSMLAIKQSNVLLAIIGLLSVTSFVITFLYCLEIINEKKHNTYKIVFIIGDMLMVITATLLFF